MDRKGILIDCLKSLSLSLSLSLGIEYISQRVVSLRTLHAKLISPSIFAKGTERWRNMMFRMFVNPLRQASTFLVLPMLAPEFGRNIMFECN